MRFSESLTAPTFLVSHPRCGAGCLLSADDCSFKIEWAINPHMKVGMASPELAVSEHKLFVQTLKEAGAEVIEMPFVHGAFDSVFAKDSAIFLHAEDKIRALLAKPATTQRRAEQFARHRALERHGIEVVGQSEFPLEGGDVILSPNCERAYLGFGVRSSRFADAQLSEFLERDVFSLELCDPYFFHLDTALNLIRVEDEVYALAYRGAFSAAAWSRLERDPLLAGVIPVPRSEALGFGLNWVEINNTIVLGGRSPQIEEILKLHGKRVVVSPLSQFQLAGGSAACLATQIHPVDNYLKALPRKQMQPWSSSASALKTLDTNSLPSLRQRTLE